jgi:hypothetical protein
MSAPARSAGRRLVGMADPAKAPAVRKEKPAPELDTSEARALAPVYDYIRSLVAQWERERSRGEDKSA